MKIMSAADNCQDCWSSYSGCLSTICFGWACFQHWRNWRSSCSLCLQSSMWCFNLRYRSFFDKKALETIHHFWLVIVHQILWESNSVNRTCFVTRDVFHSETNYLHGCSLFKAIQTCFLSFFFLFFLSSFLSFFLSFFHSFFLSFCLSFFLSFFLPFLASVSSHLAESSCWSRKLLLQAVTMWDVMWCDVIWLSGSESRLLVVSFHLNSR